MAETNNNSNDDVVAAIDTTTPSEESEQEMITRHKKELKALEGEKRAYIKKVKSTAGKGKKAKEAIAGAEKEYEEKETTLKNKHKTELSRVKPTISTSPPPPPTTTTTTEEKTPSSVSAKNKKLAKKQRQRQKALETEKAREEQIARELRDAGPSKRDIELQLLREQYLDPRNLMIMEISADGNCLYRSVGVQMGMTFEQVRNTCANVLQSNPSEYQPFTECSDYNAYVERVRSSSDWGGQLELRALSEALRKKIVVFSMDGIVTMGDEHDDDDEGILLSFHKDYYALGEHYNAVVKRGV